MRMKFTTRSIEALRPRDKPYEVADTDLKGLLLRVQPSGLKTFPVQWGRGKRVTLKPSFPTLSPEAARERAMKILVDAGEHGAPTAARPRGTNATFNEFLVDYEPKIIAENKAGAAAIANLKAQFGPVFGTQPLTYITDKTYEKHVEKRRKAGISPSTINRDHDRLRSALNQAVRWKLIPSNPLAGIKHLKVDESNRVRFLSAVEERRLRDALTTREYERRCRRIAGNAWAIARGQQPRPVWADDGFTDHLMPMTLLALNTGLRRGELLGLKPTSVDFSNKQLTVQASTAKNQKTRHVALNFEARDVLTRWLRYHGDGVFVFAGEHGEQMTHINRSWAGLMKAAKLTNFHFHDCRHHFASWLVMGGVELNTVRELMGHSDLKMTLRYAHLAPEHKAAAVEVLGRR